MKNEIFIRSKSRRRWRDRIRCIFISQVHIYRVVPRIIAALLGAPLGCRVLRVLLNVIDSIGLSRAETGRAAFTSGLPETAA